jgi:hypothetical protein
VFDQPGRDPIYERALVMAAALTEAGLDPTVAGY